MPVMCAPSSLSRSYTNNRDQEQLDNFLQYESEEWNNTDCEDFPPEGLSDDHIGGEVVHGENVANML